MTPITGTLRTIAGHATIVTDGDEPRELAWWLMHVAKLPRGTRLVVTVEGAEAGRMNDIDSRIETVMELALRLGRLVERSNASTDPNEQERLHQSIEWTREQLMEARQRAERRVTCSVKETT